MLLSSGPATADEIIPKSVHEEWIHQNYDIDNFELSMQDIEKIERMDTGKSLILDVPSLNEVYRLHNIRFHIISIRAYWRTKNFLLM